MVQRWISTPVPPQPLKPMPARNKCPSWERPRSVHGWSERGAAKLMIAQQNIHFRYPKRRYCLFKSFGVGDSLAGYTYSYYDHHHHQTTIAPTNSTIITTTTTATLTRTITPLSSTTTTTTATITTTATMTTTITTTHYNYQYMLQITIQLENWTKYF